ncbi:hypothetical protein PCANC_03259 [Puccinia coronata f. sp. avenae]|uniref:Uncharacterized protein n=1 Tax=Puccinia coronata f. sp. avenae TaxID=200324 RepID=A0A2N5VZ21_9BASI|nr:hypothetical protein PCANC_03259 [Puccinia coronata f. sp. avenae]
MVQGLYRKNLDLALAAAHPLPPIRNPSDQATTIQKIQLHQQTPQQRTQRIGLNIPITLLEQCWDPSYKTDGVSYHFHLSHHRAHPAPR